MSIRPGRPKRIVRVCWERLAESPVRRSFNHVPGEVGDIESEWAMFCASIVEATDWSCGLSWRPPLNPLVDISGEGSR